MNPYILFLIGVFAGSIITCILAAFKQARGTLLIDRSDPGKDIYRICLDSLDDLAKKKEVILKVDPNADLSQDEQSLL